MCYGLPDRKDETSSNGVDPEGPVPSAILLKEATAPDVAAITEVRLREYASHGRRGLVASQRILNDPTLPHLAAQALAHVQAEADMVAHSDMVGGRAGTLRAELDQTDFKHDPIMNYSAKYANVFNGPLR
jgi:porphobilinogen synthase